MKREREREVCGVCIVDWLTVSKNECVRYAILLRAFMVVAQCKEIKDHSRYKKRYVIEIKTGFHFFILHASKTQERRLFLCTKEIRMKIAFSSFLWGWFFSANIMIVGGGVVVCMNGLIDVFYDLSWPFGIYTFFLCWPRLGEGKHLYCQCKTRRINTSQK